MQYVRWYFKDGTPATTADVGTPKWGAQMRKIDNLLGNFKYKVVAQTTLPDGKWVSTVWLGLDHNLHSEGPPLIFETMVFSHAPRKNGLGRSLDQERYSTLEEAGAGHEALVYKWKKDMTLT